MCSSIGTSTQQIFFPTALHSFSTNALTFSYTVGAGQNTSGLSATAVNLNAATVTDGAGNAANLSLTGLLYGVCCAILGGLLALDSIVVAIIIAVPLLLAVWLITLRYLLRGAAAVNRGERYDIPSWICARIVT